MNTSCRSQQSRRSGVQDLISTIWPLPSCLGERGRVPNPVWLALLPPVARERNRLAREIYDSLGHCLTVANVQLQAALTLHRAGQEGLTNVRKHAHATHTSVVLDFQATSKVRFSVTDDGIGALDGGSSTSGFGLLGLRERAQLLGGEVRVRTAPKAGFTLEIEVPG